MHLVEGQQRQRETLDKQTVPVLNPIVLQGGIDRNEEIEAETFAGAINGETLTKAPQKVPGGLAGLFNCPEISNFIERVACEVVFENGLTGVNRDDGTRGTGKHDPDQQKQPDQRRRRRAPASREVAPGKPAARKRMLRRLEAFRTRSSGNLRTGTTKPPAPNKPISGKTGEVIIEEEANFVEIRNNTLVDNSWAAPEATGCGGVFAFAIDPLIDSKITFFPPRRAKTPRS